MYCVNQMKYLDTEHGSQESYNVFDLHISLYILRVTTNFEEVIGKCMYLRFLEVISQKKGSIFLSASRLQNQFVSSPPI
jgi:hypothetical protein